MPKALFSAEEFKPTEFSTAQDKAAFGTTSSGSSNPTGSKRCSQNLLQPAFQLLRAHSSYVERVIMRSLGVICRVDTAFTRSSTLHDFNRSWLYAAPGLRIVGKSRKMSQF